MCSLLLCTILVLHALGIISDTLKGIASNHFPQRYKFLRKEMVLISLMMAPNCSLQYLKRVGLRSTHLDRYDVLKLLLERHNHVQDQAWEKKKTEQLPLKHSIPVVKSNQSTFILWLIWVSQRC